MKRGVVAVILLLLSSVGWFVARDSRPETDAPTREVVSRPTEDPSETLAAMIDSRSDGSADGSDEIDSSSDSHGTRIRGRVRDALGEFPKDVVIEVERDGERILASRCGPDGSFGVRIDFGGVVTIVATSSGWSSTPRRLRTETGCEHDVGTLRIERLQPITGIVVDDLDHPIANATILVIADREESDRGPFTTSATDGAFRIESQQRVRALHVTASGHLPRMLESESPPLRIVMERAIEHRGVVIDARSGAAIPGAIVDRSPCASDGSFVVTRAPRDRGPIRVRAPGHVRRTLDLPSAPDESLTIRLDPLEDLAGIVLDPDGEPLPSALVQCLESPASEPATQARSDRGGRFQLPVDGSASVTVVASKGHLLGRVAVPARSGRDREITIHTERRRLATIQGLVRSHVDVATASVVLTQDGSPARFAPVDPRGRFRFDDVEPGHVALAAFEDAAAARRAARGRAPGSGVRIGVTLDLSGGDHHDVILALAPSTLGRIRGIARDHGRAAGHLAVLLTPLSVWLDGSHRKRIATSPHGSYEFAEVVDGRYRLALVNRLPIERTDYTTPLEELELCSTTIDVSGGDTVVDLDAHTDLLVFEHVNLARDLRLSHRGSTESRLDPRRARAGFLVAREPLVLHVVTTDGRTLSEPIPPLGDREIDLAELIR